MDLQEQMILHCENRVVVKLGYSVLMLSFAAMTGLLEAYFIKSPSPLTIARVCAVDSIVLLTVADFISSLFVKAVIGPESISVSLPFRKRSLIRWGDIIGYSSTMFRSRNRYNFKDNLRLMTFMHTEDGATGFRIEDDMMAEYLYRLLPDRESRILSNIRRKIRESGISSRGSTARSVKGLAGIGVILFSLSGFWSIPVSSHHCFRAISARITILAAMIFLVALFLRILVEDLVCATEISLLEEGVIVRRRFFGERKSSYASFTGDSFGMMRFFYNYRLKMIVSMRNFNGNKELFDHVLERAAKERARPD